MSTRRLALIASVAVACGGKPIAPAPDPDEVRPSVAADLIVSRAPRDRFRSFSFGPEPAVPGSDRIRIEEPQLPDATGALQWHTIVTGLDDGGGARWRVDVPQWGHTAIGEQAVAVCGTRSIVIIDAATGVAVEHVHPAESGWPRAAVDGTNVVAAGATGDGTGWIRGFADGALRWTRPLPVEHGGALVIDDDLVFVQTQGGVLYALDLETGVTRWDLSLGDNLQLRADDGRLRVASDDEVIELDPRGEPPPLERATITGTVSEVACGALADVVVAAGDVRTRPDTRGAFTIDVEARGDLRVWIPGSVADDASIPLAGRGRYDAGSLLADLCDYD